MSPAPICFKGPLKEVGGVSVPRRDVVLESQVVVGGVPADDDRPAVSGRADGGGAGAGALGCGRLRARLDVVADLVGDVEAEFGERRVVPLPPHRSLTSLWLVANLGRPLPHPVERPLLRRFPAALGCVQFGVQPFPLLTGEPRRPVPVDAVADHADREDVEGSI
jgi:hypothetical protein